MIGLASNLVETDEEYRNVIKSLLGRFIVADTMDNATRAARKFNYTLRVVTLEGELLMPGGSITGGAFKNNNNFLGKSREIGDLKKISAYEYISKLKDVKTDSSLPSILQALLLLASIGLIFYNPVSGIMFTIVLFFVNVITYFRKKALVSGYFTIVFFILGLLRQANELKKSDDPEIKEYIDRILNASKCFRKLKRNSFLIMNGDDGNPLGLLLDYLKMAFHIDLIKFNSMAKEFADHSDDFDLVFETVGYLD